MGKKSKIIMGLAVGAMIPAMLTGCGHKEHDPKDEWKTDATYHWHECEGEKCDEQLNKAEHEAATVYSHNATHHWKECTECEYDLFLEQHTFDKEVVESTYLKTEATATTKAVYYKSCICGEKGTETFESGLKIGTISNLAIAGKVYDGTAVNAPTYDKNTDGTATIEYKLKTAADTTYTTVAPINAGEYTARVSIAETANHTSVSETKDFTIAKKALTEATVTKVYDGTTAISNYSLTGKCTGLVGSDVVTLSATLNSKDVETAESVTNIQLAGASASNYTLAEGEVTATVTKFIFKELNTTVEYNGNNIHYIDMSQIEAGLRIEVTFDGASVICNAIGARVLEGEVESTNFGIDVDPSSEEKCTVAIVAKKVGIVWTAPENMAFDGTAKVPTATIDGLVNGEIDVPVITLCEDHDNITYGSSFQFKATFENQNYEIVSGETSPVYTVEDITEITVGTDVDLGLTTDYGKDNYFKISLEKGFYCFEFVQSTQNFEFAAELYKQGNPVDDIINVSFDENDFIAFEIEETGEYYLKCNQINNAQPQYDVMRIVIDEHTTPDEYGFCDKGCGTYLGDIEFVTNSWTSETMTSGDVKYYRFADAGDVQYNIEYYESDGNGLTIKCYRTDNDGNFEEVSLSETASEFIGSFDGYYYLVIKYYNALGNDKSFTFQIEQTNKLVN